MIRAAVPQHLASLFQVAYGHPQLFLARLTPNRAPVLGILCALGVALHADVAMAALSLVLGILRALGVGLGSCRRAVCVVGAVFAIRIAILFVAKCEGWFLMKALRSSL